MASLFLMECSIPGSTLTTRETGIVEPANIETKDFKNMAFYCLALFPKRNIVSMSFELLQFCELEICVKIKLQGLQR